MKTLILILIAIACLNALPEILSQHYFLNSLSTDQDTGYVEDDTWTGERLERATVWGA